jgi:hypothetical protein
MKVCVPKWSNLEWEMDTRQQGKSRRLVGHDTWWIVPVDLIVPVEPTARLTDPTTSHAAAQRQTPAKVRTEHRLVLELLQYEPLSDFDLATRASQALARPVKQTSIGVRRKELVTIGLVRDSGRKGLSDTGSPCIVWEITTAGRQELAA